MQALILAGGRGMALRPLTDYIPQSLQYLPGGTILDYLLHHLSSLEEINETALILQYRGDEVARHMAKTPKSNYTLIPQHAPFTLLSALASAASWVREPTLVLHGNYYFSQNLRYFIDKATSARSASSASFLVSKANAQKSRLQASGAYLLPPQAFHIAKELVEKDDLQAFSIALAKKGIRATTHPVKGWAREITTPSDLLAVNRYLLTQWHDAMHPPEAARGYDALNFNWIAPDAEVDSHFHGLFVTIGPKAIIRKSQLYNSLLMPGVALEGANKQNAVLAHHHTSLLQIYSPAMNR